MYIIFIFCTKLIILRTSFKLKLKFILSVNFNNLLIILTDIIIILRTFILSNVYLNNFIYSLLYYFLKTYDTKTTMTERIKTVLNKRKTLDLSGLTQKIGQKVVAHVAGI